MTFNNTLDNQISGVLSGAGTIVQKGTVGLTLSNAGNTFSGAIQIDSGALNLKTDTVSGTVSGLAAIQMGSGTSLNVSTQTGLKTNLTNNTISGTNYTFTSSGGGEVEMSRDMTPNKMILNGSTTIVTGKAAIDSLGAGAGIEVNGDSTLALNYGTGVTAGTAQPWALTLYKGTSDAMADMYTPASTIAATTTVYTGADWANFNVNAQPTAWNMDQAANDTSSATVRTYLPNYSTLSYTTDVYIPETITLDMGGFFDDTISISFFPIDSEGSYDATNTAYSVTSGFYAKAYAYGMTLPAGWYHLDARVGDRTGGAAPVGGNAVDSNGTAIGLGIRLSTGDTASNVYSRMDIDSETGYLAFSDGSILSTDSVSHGTIDFDAPIHLASGTTLTLDNRFANSAINVSSSITGAGTVALANTEGGDLVYTYSGTSEGSFEAEQGVNFSIVGATIGGNVAVAGNSMFSSSGNAAIAGNLVLDSGTVAVIEAGLEIGGDFMIAQGGIVNIEQSAAEGGIFSVGGTLDAPGAIFNITATDLTTALGISAQTTDLTGATFNITVNGDPNILDTWTLIDSEDAASTWADAEINFTFTNNPDARVFAQFADGKYQLVVGNSASIPEPSSWILLVLGAAGLFGAAGYRCRRRPTVASSR